MVANRLLNALFLLPFYFLQSLKIEYFIFFIVCFSGVLTSIEQLSIFFLGSEIFVAPDISIQNFIWIAMFLLIVIRFAFIGGFRIFLLEPWAIFYLLLMLYCAFTVIWSENTFKALRDLLQNIFPFLVTLLCLISIKNHDGLKRLLNSMWLGLFLVVLLTIFTFLSGRPLFGIDYGGAERFWGPMGWSALGYYLLPFCVACFYSVISRGKLIDWLFFSLVTFVFLITLGRLALISFFTAVFLIYFYWGGEGRRKFKLGLAGGILVLVAISLVLPSIIQRTFGQYGEFQWSGRTNSAGYVSSRLESTNLGFLFGYGAGTARTISEELIGVSSEVRSKYFIMYTDYGVVGLSLYLLFLFTLLCSSIRLYAAVSRFERGKYTLLSQALALRLACCVFIIFIGAFDNLSFIYITSLYFLFFTTGPRSIGLKDAK